MGCLLWGFGSKLTTLKRHCAVCTLCVVCWLYHRTLLLGEGKLTNNKETNRFPGPWLNIKMSSYQYRKSHCGDKTILRPSYLHNGISYTGKMTSLYWIRALISYGHCLFNGYNLVSVWSIWLMWQCRHSRVSMVVADDPVPMWCQDISNHDDVVWSV